MKSLSLLLFFVVFAAVLGSKTIENGFFKNQSSSDPKNAVVEIAVIDQEHSEKLFREFASHTEIPYKYPLDGCYARATAMNKLAEKDNVIMGRVYAKGLLVVNTDSTKYPEVMWGWHVAPVAYVRQPDGTDKLMVYDPSLFKKPVTVDEWTHRMKDTAKNGTQGRVDSVYYGARYQYLALGWEENKTTWDLDIDQKVEETFVRYRPLEDKTAPVSGHQQLQPQQRNMQVPKVKSQNAQGAQ